MKHHHFATGLFGDGEGINYVDAVHNQYLQIITSWPTCHRSNSFSCHLHPLRQCFWAYFDYLIQIFDLNQWNFIFCAHKDRILAKTWLNIANKFYVGFKINPKTFIFLYRMYQKLFAVDKWVEEANVILDENSGLLFLIHIWILFKI